MRAYSFVLTIVIQIAVVPVVAHARTNVVVVHNLNEASTPGFKLRVISPPSSEDAATKSTFSIVDGRRDGNGADVDKLHDGKVPMEGDQPSESFFFDAGTSGGRLLVDLGQLTAIDQVNTYSWHSSTRGPQVFQLYGSDGNSEGFIREPKQGRAPEQSGWKLMARVDTRPVEGEHATGGQYAVSIFDSDGPLGTCRYLLFDISATENDDPFGNTFYSEIDVVPSGTAAASGSTAIQPLTFMIETDGAKYEATIDTSETPDLTEWADKELTPVVKEWYPKIIALLPSEKYEAPQSFTITLSPQMRGVAATGGTQIRCSADWFRRNLRGEAKGAVVHELVHVVQQYGRARRANPNATRPPGWLVEGIADYIRWFLYEPQSRGAEITAANISQAKYDMSYRGSANFLNWVTERHDRKLVTKLNAALREGRYKDDLWSDYSGRTLAELGDEWKGELNRRLADKPADKSSTGKADAAAPAESRPASTLRMLAT
jgi:hypothetical protein